MKLQSRDPNRFGQFAPARSRPVRRKAAGARRREPRDGPPVWIWYLTGLFFLAGLVLGFVLIPSLLRYLFGL